MSARLFQLATLICLLACVVGGLHAVSFPLRLSKRLLNLREHLVHLRRQPLRKGDLRALHPLKVRPRLFKLAFIIGRLPRLVGLQHRLYLSLHLRQHVPRLLILLSSKLGLGRRGGLQLFRGRLILLALVGGHTGVVMRKRLLFFFLARQFPLVQHTLRPRQPGFHLVLLFLREFLFVPTQSVVESASILEILLLIGLVGLSQH